MIRPGEDVDDEIDLSEVSRWGREMRRPGHQSVYNHGAGESDKLIVEISTAADWCSSMQTSFGVVLDGPEAVVGEPVPDCYVWTHPERGDEDRRTVELTELRGTLTSPQLLEEAITATLQRKGDRYGFAVDVLLFHCDDRWLRMARRCEVCATCTHPLGLADIWHVCQRSAQPNE